MTERPKRQRLSLPAIAGIVSTVAVLLYAPTLEYDYTYLDDTTLILARSGDSTGPSSLTRSFTRTYTGVPSDSYYRPLVNLSLALDAKLTGVRPTGYHATNTLLHAIAGLLVASVLWQLGLGALPVLGGALLFVLHPVQVASVAWIPGRNDLLMTCFGLGATLSLLRDLEQPTVWLKAGHVLGLLFALLSKEAAFCLPLVWWVLLWAVGSARSGHGRRWMWTGWLSVLAIATAARLAVVTLPQGYVAERLHTAVVRLPVLLADLGKLVCPVKLQVLSSPRDILLWPGIVATIVLGVAVWAVPGVRRRIAILALALLIVPMLASLPGARHVVLENRLYLPVAGLAILAAEVLRASGSISSPLRIAPVIVASTALAALGIAAVLHSSNYRNRERFSEAAIVASPRSSIAANLRFRRFYSRDIGTRMTGPERPAPGRGTE